MSHLQGLVLLLGWILLPAWASSPMVYQAQVVSVIDGDTLWVRPLGQRAKKKLRLMGLDAPEICQAGGRESRAALKALVAGQRLEVREHGRDIYGRGLVLLLVDGKDVAAQMVASGHAWSERSAGSAHRYAEQEKDARQARRGLFLADKPQWPGDFRKQHGSCYPPRKS